MEAENDKLAQKIRHQLRDYEKQPPEYVWENIRKELSQNTARNGALIVMVRKHWYVAVALAAAILFLLFVFSFASDAGIYNNTLQNNTPVANQEQGEINILHSIQSSVSATNTPPAATQIEKRNIAHLKETNAFSFTKQDIVSVSALNPFHINTITFDKIEDSPLARSEKKHPEKKELQINDNEYDEFNGISAITPANNKWAFGFFATPELLYGNTNTSGGQSSFSADFAVMYKFNHYFLQSGISLEAANDNSNANINYLQTEFMGSYQDVYDVTFDTTNGTPRPVYHTQEVEVYDTTEHQTSTLYTNNYNYLSVPLLMGYKQRLNERLAYSLKAGPMVSFMLRENSQFAFNYQDAQIQAIQNMPADRVTTNWQALLSLGLHYKVHKQVHFTLEPQMKYYFNPVYNTQPGSAKETPFALGLRTGLIVGF